VEGAGAVATADGAASLVELKCETDFTAKSDAVTSLVQELADAVLAEGPEAVATRVAALDELKLTTKENLELGLVERFEVSGGNHLDAYVHRQDGRGKVGVLVEADGGTPEQLHEVALHVAFAKPTFLRREEVPAEEVDKERAFLEQQTRDEGKPEAAMGKIVEGKLTAYFKGKVLLEQDLFGEKGNPVSKALGEGTVTRFVVASVGA
jgi:elongation factor Ts